MKSVQMWRFLWSIFSVFQLNTEIYGARKQEKTDQKKLRIWKFFTQWYFEKCLYPILFFNFCYDILIGGGSFFKVKCQGAGINLKYILASNILAQF